jgi:serine O-acetyltransferase
MAVAARVVVAARAAVATTRSDLGWLLWNFNSIDARGEPRASFIFPRAILRTMELATQDARLKHLAGLAAARAGAAPPSDTLLLRTLESLRMLVFPQLRGPTHPGDELAREVVAGFDALIREAFAACGMAVDATVADRFVAAIPAISARLAADVRAAYDGDPAARNDLEIVVCYPGIRALAIHRFAHELDAMGVPLLPRMMAEHAHRDTGIDIHPRATIGDALFIDHGTGVVIGETATIGHRCRIYQGVTLGAKNFDREPDGSMKRGYRRHPTLEDDVVVYAGATILGGDTVIGKGSVVAGGVFLTKSVPPGHVVTGPKVELRVISMGGGI